MRISLLILVLISGLVTGCSDTNDEVKTEEWETSPTFNIGEISKHEVQGEKGKLVVDNTPFIAGKTQKYMWYFWDNEEVLNAGNVRIEAKHEKTGEKHKALVTQTGTKDEKKIWEVNSPPGPPNNGADAHMPSNLSLSYEGLWKLNVYIGDELFGNVIVEVS